MKVKRGPHAYEHWGIEQIAVLRHPPLLFRRAEPYPDDIRARGVNHLDDSRVLAGGERTKRGRVGANDVKGGETSLEPHLEVRKGRL
jgi:hypothetical protein